MKVEIHAHTRDHSPCSRILQHELIAMAEATGYDVVFVTDHGKIWSPRELAEIREWSEHVLVLPGIEISLSPGVDILVLGAENPIYETLISPSDIFAQACAEDCLTVIAHPFRWMETLPPYCALADAIEVRTCNHPGGSQADTALQFADEKRLAPVYSSDAHGLNFMNRFWIETEEAFATAKQFRRILLSGRYTNRMRDETAELPPAYKAATMDELSPEDRLVLQGEPTL